eukprot:s5033_g9.t1
MPIRAWDFDGLTSEFWHTIHSGPEQMAELMSSDSSQLPQDGAHPAGNDQLIAALQARLKRALSELRACRQNENATTTDRPHFSCDVKDHADVLGPHLEEACATPGRTTRSRNVQANSTPASGMEEVDRKLTEELSMAKALLMLNNVSLCMDLDEGAEDLSAADVVRLKGNPRLIQLLITLKQKALGFASVPDVKHFYCQRVRDVASKRVLPQINVVITAWVKAC